MLNRIIERPVLATVISIILVLLGVVGLLRIPMTQFPEIAPPTVFVAGMYPGANAENVVRSVITPLEQAINGVENMQYMTSSSSNDGSFSITIIFKQGVNPDQAAVNVQNRVAQANAQLPAEVIRLGLTTTKQQTSNLMVVNINSEKPELYDEAFLQNYANINLLPELKRIPGVGNVSTFGAKDYSVRVWINPIKLSSYGLVPADVETAIQNYSFESSPGSFGQETDASLQYVLRYKGKLSKPEEFEQIILRAKTDGSLLRLADVARVEFGLSSYSSDTFTDGKPSVVFAVIQASGSNANRIAIEVEKSLKKFQASVPDGITFDIIQNTKDRLDASISQMQWTLVEAFVLVFVVVLVFLQDFRSTLIPAIAVPVSIIGTFFFIYLIGFSVNVLTLFALVLAIGIVVDDAIVVVEAVHAKMQQTGQDAKTAVGSTMSEISGAVISITLVMSAVFLPVGFMEGPAGIFYQQFSYTLAIAILISAVNALTLSPALCALILKNRHQSPQGEKSKFTERFADAFNTGFECLTEKYTGALKFLSRRKSIVIAALLLIGAGAFFLTSTAQKGFVPEEDDNNLTFVVNLQAGANLQFITKEMEKVTKIVLGLPEVRSISTVSGFSLFSSGTSPNGAMGFITLKNPKDRGETADIEQVMQKIEKAMKGKIRGEILIFRNPAVEGFGTAGGVEFVLQDRTSGNLSDFEAISKKVIDALAKRPEIGTAFTSFRSDYPQYEVIVSEDKAQQLGLTPKEVMDALQLYLTGSQTTDFVRFGMLYRVNVRSEADYRKDEASLNSILIRNKLNQMVPIATLVTLKKIYGPQGISRYNLYNSISVNVNAAPGTSTGQAMTVIDQVLEKELPKGYSYEYSGLSLQERNSSSQMVFIFGLSLLFVYLLLAAQYESYLLPLSVLLSLPTGILGVFLATGFTGIDNNIYVQIALIMLIGLLAKNAILIVEFAIQQRTAGLSVVEAGIAGARMRLRPILMTSFAFIAGLIPLMFAKGGTAVGNRSISISAAGGMLSGVILGVMIIPVLYMLFQSLHEKISVTKKPIAINPAIKYSIILVLTAAVLQSCKVTQYYARPELSLPQSFNPTSDTKIEGKRTAEIPAYPQFFSDTSLVAILDKVMANNPDLLVASEQLVAAEAALKGVKLNYLPDVNLQVNAGIQRLSRNSMVGSFAGGLLFEEYNLAPALSWEIAFWGKLRMQRKEALSSYLGQAENRRALRVQLIALTAQAYYNLLSLDEQLRITQTVENSMQETLEMLGTQFKVAEATSLAVQQSLAQLTETRALIAEIKASIKVQENALQALAGSYPASVARTQRLPIHPFETVLHAGIPANLLTNRPDVKQRELQLQAANARVGIAKTAFYPSLTLTGQGGINSIKASSWFSIPASLFGTAAAGLTQPLFNKRNITSSYQQALHHREAAVHEFRKSVLVAVEEVSTSLSNITHINEQITEVNKRKAAMDKAVSDARLLYQYGDATYLEVLSVQQSHLQTELAYITLMQKQINAYIAMYKSLGGN